jgi:hypothetical protein
VSLHVEADLVELASGSGPPDVISIAGRYPVFVRFLDHHHTM